MTDHDLAPLPCSLDPLADESLPGYLLRLAHRLELAPIRILHLTGLVGGDRKAPTPRTRGMMTHLAQAQGRMLRPRHQAHHNRGHRSLPEQHGRPIPLVCAHQHLRPLGAAIAR
jgi:hypothetical protein